MSQESIRSLRDSGSLDGEDLDLPPVSPSSASPTLMTTTLRPKSVPGRLEGNLEAQLAAPVVVRPASSYSTQLQKKPAIPKSMLVKWHSDFVQQLDQVSRDLKQLQTAKIRRHSDSEAMDSAEQLAATGSGEAGVLSSSNYLFHAASPDPNNISHLKGLKATLEFRAGRVLHLIDMARRTTLLQLKAYHMAHQLSILEQSLFLQIKPQDLLNHHPPHNSNPAIQAQTDFFNFVARVVEHSILSEPNVGNRARAIHQWAKVSQHLLQIRNVQSLRAVSAAMQTPPVARLKKTWAIVPTKSMKSIEQIRSLLSEQNNYYVYREWCARGGGINIADILGSAPAAMGPGGGSSHGHASSSTGRLPRPAVPFFGVYIHDTYYLMAALKKERVAGPSGTLDNETILKDRRMQEIVDQIVYYQSGGTYAPVSAGKGDLALSTGSRDSSKESLHLRDGGSLAMGVLRGIGSATVNLARRSAKPSSVGISDGPVSASASGTPPMGMTAVVPGTVEDQLKEMDDETASMFTQHWILSREWYTEKDVDDLSVQREPKAEDDGHSMHFSYGNGSAGTSERVTSSVISTTSTSTGGTLVDRDRDRDRDSIVSSHFGYRDSIASDVSLGDLAEASTSIGAGTPGPKKSWSLKKMMKDIGGGFNASGRPESIAAEVINEAFIGDDERREEKRRSGGEITDGRQRRSMGAGPTPRELMAQAGRTLAERRTFAGYDNPPLELSTDSSLDSSPFASPVNSRPTSTVSTPNQSLDDIEPSPGPLPIRSRASRSPERDLSSSVGSVTGVEARRLSHFPAGSSVGSDLGTSPTSAPSVGKAPFGVRFEKGAREGDLNSDSMSTGTHQRTQSAGRLSGWPPGAFGYTISVPKPADSASLPADKALLARRSTAQASVAGGAPSAPSATGERPRSIAVIGTKAAGGAPAASAYSTATPAVNESASDKRKPIRGFALPGMAPSVPP